MTEFRSLNGEVGTLYVAAAASRLLAANLAESGDGHPLETSNQQRLHANLSGPDIQHQIRRQIITLQLEHRELDRLVREQTGGASERLDELRLRRLKKQKLRLKDRIAALQMRLVPDILA